MLPFARTLAALLLGLGACAGASGADDAPAANAKARAEAAARVYQGTLARARVDPGAGLDPERLYQWSRRWMEAEEELSDKNPDRIAAAERHLERMKKLEATIKQLFEKNGSLTAVDVAAQTYFRLEAERNLAQVKGK